MRTWVLVLLLGLVCLGAGFFAGSEACQRARMASAQGALRRANEAMAVGRQDEALEYAFAALDRDRALYAAYELAGDAVAVPQHSALARHYYRAALGAVGPDERARIEAKLAALSADP